jgi:hypothetical protein
MSDDLRGDQHKALALTAYLLHGTPPSVGAMAATPRAGRPAGEQLQNLWALDNVLALVDAKPGDRQRYVDLLLDFLAIAERTHWSQWESGGYRRYQFLAWRAAYHWAALNGENALVEAARGYLRNLLTLAALMANGHGRVIAVVGRIQLPRSSAWTEKGDVEVDQDLRIRALLGFDDVWWPPKGVGPAYLRAHGDWIAAMPGLVRPLFTDGERVVLSVWVRSGIALHGLAALVAPICLPQRLHILRSRDGHVAWAEDVRSEGTRTCQPLAYSVKRAGTPEAGAVGRKQNYYDSRFVVTKPPAGAVRIARGSWSVGGAGASLGTANAAVVGADWTEIVIDLDGGRIVGETAEPPAPPAEPPTTPPPGDPALRLVRERLAEHRATWDRQKKGKAKAAETERTLRAVEAAVEGL